MHIRVNEELGIGGMRKVFNKGEHNSPQFFGLVGDNIVLIIVKIN